MGIVVQHLPADVSCDGHDGLVAQSALSQFRYGLVSQVVKPESVEGAFQAFNVSVALLILADSRRPLNRFAVWTGDGAGEATPGAAPILHRPSGVKMPV